MQRISFGFIFDLAPAPPQGWLLHCSSQRKSEKLKSIVLVLSICKNSYTSDNFTHSPLISPTLIKVYQRSLVHPYNDFEMISQLAKCQKSKAKLVSYPPPLARFSWHYRQTLRILLCLQQGVLLRLLQNVVHHLGFSCHSLRRNTSMLTAAPSGRDF